MVVYLSSQVEVANAISHYAVFLLCQLFFVIDLEVQQLQALPSQSAPNLSQLFLFVKMPFLAEGTSLELSFLTACAFIGFSSTKADYITLCKKAIYA